MLKRFISTLFRTEKQHLNRLKIIFCSDEYLLRINKEFLQHDELTDIITFELSEHPDFTEGEIYISLDRVVENAEAFRAPKHQETLRVIFHGVLHLCGYGDKSVVQKKKMREREDFYLNRYYRFVSREKRST